MKDRKTGIQERYTMLFSHELHKYSQIYNLFVLICKICGQKKTPVFMSSCQKKYNLK